ncbi:MAG: hypothetical protein ACREIS_00815 [Nitrospiraceae bacterium]
MLAWLLFRFRLVWRRYVLRSAARELRFLLRRYPDEFSEGAREGLLHTAQAYEDEADLDDWEGPWPSCLMGLDVTHYGTKAGYKIIMSGGHWPDLLGDLRELHGLESCDSPDGCQGRVPRGRWYVKVGPLDVDG